ncbi:MAG: hypothetical protein ACTHJ4_06050 [Candidatus Nucleicultricaceae bacterium]
MNYLEPAAYEEVQSIPMPQNGVQQNQQPQQYTQVHSNFTPLY